MGGWGGCQFRAPVRFLLLFFFNVKTTVLSHWDFLHEKFGLLSPGKANCDRSALPNRRCMPDVFNVSTIRRTLIWTKGSLSCAQILMHVIAHRGVRTHVRESAAKVDSGRKKKNPSPHGGIEPASAACRSDALPTELHPHPTLGKCFGVPASFSYLLRCVGDPVNLPWLGKCFGAPVSFFPLLGEWGVCVGGYL